MAFVSIRFGRGIASLNRYQVGRRLHRTEVEQFGVELDSGVSLVHEQAWEGETYKVGNEFVTKDVWEDALHAAGLDKQVLRKQLDRKMDRVMADHAERHGAFGFWE